MITEERLFGLFLILIGSVLIFFCLKWIKQFKKEKYNPFSDNKNVMKRRMFIQSYTGLVFGILLILFSIIFIFFL